MTFIERPGASQVMSAIPSASTSSLKLSAIVLSRGGAALIP
jgi:hypothetical protein